MCLYFILYCSQISYSPEHVIYDARHVMHAENYEVINTENIRPCYHQLLELFVSSSRKDTCIWRIRIKLRTLNLTQIHYVSHFPVLQSALLQSALALKHIIRDMIERLWKTKHLHYTLFDFKTGQIWKNEKKNL